LSDPGKGKGCESDEEEREKQTRDLHERLRRQRRLLTVSAVWRAE
jgi:hypothetical protein